MHFVVCRYSQFTQTPSFDASNRVIELFWVTALGNKIPDCLKQWVINYLIHCFGLQSMQQNCFQACTYCICGLCTEKNFISI